MRIVADTHVHFYPCYDYTAALGTLVGNLTGLSGGDAVKVAFLTERFDCNFYSDLVEGKTAVEGYELEVINNDRSGAAVFTKDGVTELYVLPGRQVVTEEEIEVLALTTVATFEDRSMSAEDLIDAVNDVGGVPVVAWAPGKWFFKRGNVVRSLIEKYEPGRFLLGDTTLRPSLWGIPLLMRLARRRGFCVLAGSDPLPFPGDEKYMGAYTSFMEGEFTADKPVTSLYNILKKKDASFENAGRRCDIFETLSRLKKNGSPANCTNKTESHG